MKESRILVSICIPVYNEADNLELLYNELLELCTKLNYNYDFEFIFTDNCSSDNSWEILKKLRKNDNRVRGFKFLSNIGFQNSIKFNYLQALGEVVVQLDADLQDPPRLIENFLSEWEKGFKIVTGLRINREEGKLLQNFRKLGYWLINAASDHPIQKNAGDFRLLDRTVVELIRNVKTPEPYLRGIVSGFRFPESKIEYSRSKRNHGVSKFGIGQLVKLGMNGFLNHSQLPLKITNFAGLFAMLLSFLGAIYFTTLRLLVPNFPRGFASLYILILFGIGINSLTLGILGNYLRKIYLILNGENQIVVDDTLD